MSKPRKLTVIGELAGNTIHMEPGDTVDFDKDMYVVIGGVRVPLGTALFSFRWTGSEFVAYRSEFVAPGVIDARFSRPLEDE